MLILLHPNGTKDPTHLMPGDEIIWDVNGETIRFHRDGTAVLLFECGDKHSIKLKSQIEFVDLCSILAAVSPQKLASKNLQKLHWNGWKCHLVEVP